MTTSQVLTTTTIVTASYAFHIGEHSFHLLENYNSDYTGSADFRRIGNQIQIGFRTCYDAGV